MSPASIGVYVLVRWEAMGVGYITVFRCKRLLASMNWTELLAKKQRKFIKRLDMALQREQNICWFGGKLEGS